MQKGTHFGCLFAWSITGLLGKAPKKSRMTNTHDCPERLRLIPASTEEKKDEEEAIKIEEGTQERKARFSFELINIEPGEEVEFWYTYKNPSGIMCKVLDDRHVEYDGKSWSLWPCPQAYERQELCPWPSLLQIQRRVARRNPHPSWGVKLL